MVVPHAFRHGNALFDLGHAPMAVRQERLGHVDLKTTMGYTHLVSADDLRVAEQLGALLNKEFFAQDLPKLPPDKETASGEVTEAIENQRMLVAGARFELATFGL